MLNNFIKRAALGIFAICGTSIVIEVSAQQPVECKLVFDDIAGYQLEESLQRIVRNTVYDLRRQGVLPQQASSFDFGKFMEQLTEPTRQALYRAEVDYHNGKITLEQLQAKVGNVLRGIGQGIITFASDATAAMIPHIGKIAAICVTAYGGVIGFRILKAYVIMYMNQPQLIRQIIHPNNIKQTLADLHFTPTLKSKLQYTIDMAKNVIEYPSRAKFENILLWGEPGTGKTAFVEILAKEAGMTVFKTSGGDFAKLKGKDLEQIDAMFRNARENRYNLFFRRKVIIFIDEMEELFGSRARANLSEDQRNVLTKLLVELSSPNSDILFVGATNRPEDLDEAMFRRMPRQIEVGLPDKAGRKAIFKLYVDKLFLQDKNFSSTDIILINKLFSDALIDKLAENVGDIAPAEIEDTVIRLKNRSMIYNKGIPTEKLIEETLKEKIEQLEARKNGFIRSSTQNR